MLGVVTYRKFTWTHMCKQHNTACAIFKHRYWCYKDFCALNLLACADAALRFTYIDVGRTGSIGDATAFKRSELYHYLDNGHALPQAAGFPLSAAPSQRFRPYLLGDAAFPKSPFLIKQFTGDVTANDSKRDFNKRHCSTRRVVESAFGHLKGCFRILTKAWCRDPEFMKLVIKACCVLHNYRKLDDDMTDLQLTADEQAAQIPDANDNPAVDTTACPSHDATVQYLMANRGMR